MTTTSTNPVVLPHVPTPLDGVMSFYEGVFTASADETPAHKAAIKALIEQSFTSGYTFNGKPMQPDALFAWRESLMTRFSQMVFAVHDALSGPVSMGPGLDISAVAMRWVVDALDTASVHWRLQGMSLLSTEGGQAASNVQLGDAENGWFKVTD